MQTEQQASLAALQQRLQWLQALASGVIYCQPSDFNFVVVEKKDTLIQLAYPDHTLQTFYNQSVLDLAQPLALASRSTQVMLLSLLWQPQPQRIYVAGCGAGRLPWLLHHWFPEAVIETTDIEPQTAVVAPLFFGVEFSDRLQLTLQDARTYLAAPAAAAPYDLMIIDVAWGNGYTPYPLVTHEFWQLCQRCLSPTGVLVVNTLPSDRFLAYKLQTLQCSFPTLYACDTDVNKLLANRILIAMQQPAISADEVQARSQQLEAALERTVPFTDYLGQVLRGDLLLQSYFDGVPSEPLLWDDYPPPQYFDALADLRPLRLPVRADCPCPCGSGRAFVTCHGTGDQT